MTTSLISAAQILLDMYHQDYAPEDAFVDLFMVKTLMYSEYERMLLDEYTRAKIMARASEGFSWVTFDDDMTTSESVEVKKEGPDYVATLSAPAFTFAFDIVGTGVQRVRNLDASCSASELIRIPRSDAWMYAIAPKANKTYFYSQAVSTGPNCPLKTQIVVLGACYPKNIDVQYLPSLLDGGDIQIASRMVKRITDSVLQSLLIAQQQIVVDKTNDSNPNALAATEANPDNTQKNP